MKVSRKIVANAFLVVVLGGLGLFLYQVMTHGHADHFNRKDDTHLNMYQIPFSFQRGIEKVSAKYQLGVDDITKIDFSYPGTDGYEHNAKMNIFHPQGGNVSRYNIDRLKAISNNTHYIFTLGNKIQGQGTGESELMAVLSRVKGDMCNKLAADFAEGGSFAISEGEINLTAHPKEISTNEIVTLPSKYGCIKTANEHFYYHLLMER